jgi:hypothetical protein
VRPVANGERPIPISLHLRRDFLGVTYGFAF